MTEEECRSGCTQRKIEEKRVIKVWEDQQLWNKEKKSNQQKSSERRSPNRRRRRTEVLTEIECELASCVILSDSYVLHRTKSSLINISVREHNIVTLTPSKGCWNWRVRWAQFAWYLGKRKGFCTRKLDRVVIGFVDTHKPASRKLKEIRSRLHTTSTQNFNDQRNVELQH